MGHALELKFQHSNVSQVSIVERKSASHGTTSSGSTSSRLSCTDMQNIMDRLIANQNRSSTMKNYLAIWRSFNKFVMRLDNKPDSWEQRTSYFAAYLLEEKKVQSATLKSYISAIKHILKCDGYKWRDQEIWLNALVKSCKLANDVIYTRFPVHFKFLEIILFEVGRILGGSQPFLECLYQAMFALSRNATKPECCGAMHWN